MLRLAHACVQNTAHSVVHMRCAFAVPVSMLAPMWTALEDPSDMHASALDAINDVPPATSRLWELCGHSHAQQVAKL